MQLLHNKHQQNYRTMAKYTRKTEDLFILKWKGEEIDETNTLKDAKYLQGEYNLAYGGGVSIKKTRVPKSIN